VLNRQGYRGCRDWRSTRPDGRGSVVGDREFLIVSPSQAIEAAERMEAFGPVVLPASLAELVAAPAPLVHRTVADLSGVWVEDRQ